MVRLFLHKSHALTTCFMIDSDYFIEKAPKLQPNNVQAGVEICNDRDVGLDENIKVSTHQSYLFFV